jgi:hypothetical protein
MLDIAEKRSYPRMDIECPASFTMEGQAGSAGAIVKSLSGGGVLMWLERAVELDTVMTIEIMPLNTITPPMKARVKVVRCTPVEGTDGQFAVGCAMERIID